MTHTHTPAQVKELIAGISDSDVQIVLGLCESSNKAGYEKGYDTGHSLGYSDGLDEVLVHDEDTIEDHIKEKIGVEYAVEAFSEITDMDQFRSKLSEINNRALNFMMPIGNKR